MTKDIRISFSFLNHRKRKKLEAMLGPGATKYLLNLWINAAMNHPKGRLDGMTPEDIAIDADYDGNPDQFISILIDTGFIDIYDDIYIIHDWEEHQSFVFHSDERTQASRKAAFAMWKKRREGSEGHTESKRDASGSLAKGNAPLPLPLPLPSPKKRHKTGPGAPASGQPKPKSKKEKIERGLELLILDLNKNMNWRRKASPGLVAKVLKNMALDPDWLTKARQAAPCVPRIDDRRWPGGKVRFEWFFQMYNARREFDPVVDKIIAGAYDMRPAPTKTYAEKEAEEAERSKDSKKADPEAVKASIKKAREAVGSLMKDFGKIPEGKKVDDGKN